MKNIESMRIPNLRRCFLTNSVVSSLILSAVFISVALQNASAQTPGGVSGYTAEYWLKADEVHTTLPGDGANVTLWLDKSGNGRNFVQRTTPANTLAPTFKSPGSYNFHPSVFWDGTTGDRAKTLWHQSFQPNTNKSYYVFTVSKPTNQDARLYATPIIKFVPGDRSPNYGNSGTGLFWTGQNADPGYGNQRRVRVSYGANNNDAGIHNTGSSDADGFNTSDLKEGLVSWLSPNHNSNNSGDTASIYLNGRKSPYWNGTGTANGLADRRGRGTNWQWHTTSQNVQLGQGGTAASFPYFGEIMEVILLSKDGNTTMDAADIQKVHSYLAVKYGITTHTDAGDYVASDGATVWSKSTNTGYNNNIFGIARDNASGLHQKQATGATDKALTIYIGSLAALNSDNAGNLNDMNFVMLGSNDKPAGSVLPYTRPGKPDINTRSQRIYRAQVTGSASAVVNLKFNALPAKYLIVSPNADLSGGTPHLLNDGVASNVMITDGYYIGFAMCMQLPGNIDITNITPIAWFTPDQYSDGTWTNRIPNTTDAVGNFTQPGSWNPGSTNKMPPPVAHGANFHNAVHFGPASAGTSRHRMISDKVIGINTDDAFSIIMVFNRTERKWANEHILNYSINSNYGSQHNLRFTSASNNELYAGWLTENRKLGNVPFGSTQLITVDNNNTNGTNGIRLYLGAQLQTPVAGSENGTADGSNTSNVNNNKIIIGGSRSDITGDGGESFTGNVQELIILKRKTSSYPFLESINTQTEFNKVHSYLAVKYGITMTDRNYVASDGATVWDRMANAGYNSTIFGIARDDASGLRQKQATGSEDNTLTVYLADLKALNDENDGTLDNMNFVMLGSNGKPAGAVQSYTRSDRPDINVRSQRIYKVQVTGSNPPTVVNLKFHAIPMKYLIVSPNDDLSGGNVYEMDEHGVAKDVEITDDDYIGFAMFMQMPGNISAVHITPIAWFTPDQYSKGTWTNRIAGAIGDFTQPSSWTGSGKVPPATAPGANFHPAVQFRPTGSGTSPHRMISDNAIGINDDDAFSIIMVFNRTQSRWANENILNYSTGTTNYEGQHNLRFPTTAEALSAGWLITARSLGNVPTGTTQLLTVDNSNTAATDGIRWHLGAQQKGTAPSEKGTANGSDNTNVNNNKIIIGGSRRNITTAGEYSFTGDIQELIILKKKTGSDPFLNDENTLKEFNKIHSYLAVKYGITMTDRNYVASNGTKVVWNRDTNNGYNHNIFGIARDDSSGLYQKQGQSVNDKSATMFVGSGAASLNSNNISGQLKDGVYVMAGSNGGSYAEVTEISPIISGSAKVNFRRGTIYKVQMTGTSGPMKVKWKMASHVMLSEYMMVSSNPNFPDDGSTKVYPTNSVTELELKNGDYIAYGGYKTPVTVGPGGVTANLKLWLRADETYSVTVGETVTSDATSNKARSYPDAPLGSTVSIVDAWKDISAGRIYNYTNGQDNNGHLKPVYQQSNYMTNYHPTLRFWVVSGASTYLSAPANAVWDTKAPLDGKHSAFFLGNYKYATTENMFYSMMFGENQPGTYTGPGYGVDKYNNNLVGRLRIGSGNSNEACRGTIGLFSEGATSILGYHTYVSGDNTVTTWRFGGKEETKNIATGSGDYSSASIIGGGYVHARGINGVLPEIIMYDGTLSNDNRNKIESYLGLKYGVMLRSDTDGDNGRFHYKFSDGSTVWNGTMTAGKYVDYYYRIAAVIRDDDAGLHNRQSHSTNVGSILHLGVAGKRLGTAADVDELPYDKEAVVWGDNGAMDITTNIASPECGKFSNIFNRIWMVRKRTKDDRPVALIVGAQDNRGTQLSVGGAHDVLFEKLVAGNTVSMIVADAPEKLTYGHTTFGQFTAVVPMSFIDGEQQCAYTFSDTITYLTFGYETSTAGCIGDIEFEGQKTFPWKQWTRATSTVLDKEAYDLGQGITATTKVEYASGITKPVNYPSVASTPVANALYVQRRGGTENSEVTVTVTFNTAVRPEFSIYDIDGWAGCYEKVSVTGSCAGNENIHPVLSYASSATASNYRINGNTARSIRASDYSQSDKRGQLNVAFTSGVSKITIKYSIEGKQPPAGIIYKVMISPIQVRKTPPPPPLNIDHLSFVKDAFDREITTCEPMEYTFLIGNMNCEGRYVNFRDTLPNHMTWDTLFGLDAYNSDPLSNSHISFNDFAGMRTLAIDSLYLPGSTTLRLAGTAHIDVDASSGATIRFNNRARLEYEADRSGTPTDVELASLDMETLEENTWFDARGAKQTYALTATITTSPPVYVAEEVVEATITVENPNTDITDTWLEIWYDAGFTVIPGTFDASGIFPIDAFAAETSEEGALVIAGDAEGTKGFTLPEGTSTFKVRLRAPTSAALQPVFDEDGNQIHDKTADLNLLYEFVSEMDDPCIVRSMSDLAGGVEVPFSTLKTNADYAVGAVGASVTVPVLVNDEIPGYCTTPLVHAEDRGYPHLGTAVVCETNKICYTSSSGAGIDSADYSVTCKTRNTSRIYFAILAGDTLYNVCSGADTTMSFEAIDGVSLHWFSVQTDGTADPASPTNSKTLSSVTAEQTWWVEPRWNGKIFPRHKVHIKVINKPTVGDILTPPSSLSLCDGAQLDGSHLGTPEITWNDETNREGSWQLETSTDTYADISLPKTVAYPADNGKKIRYRATNACGDTYSGNTITLTVHPPLAGGITAGADQTVCGDEIPVRLTITSTLSGGDGAYTYQWQDSIGSGTSWSDITDSTNATYTFVSSLSATTGYRVRVTSCNSTVISSRAIITVTSGFDPGAITAANSTTICNNTAAPELSLSTLPSGGSGSYSWKWQVKTASGGSWSDIDGTANQNSYSPGTLTATRWYCVLVTDNGVSGGCGQQSTNEVKITVHPVPTVEGILDQTVCNGDATATVSFSTSTSSDPPVTYSWATSTDIGITSGVGNIASFTALNTGTTLKTADITVTPKIGTCEGTQETFSIKVLPTPTVNNISNQTVCKDGETAEVIFGTTITGATVTYEWLRSGDNIGLNDASGTGNFPVFTATNSTGIAVSNTVTVAPKITIDGVTCTGASESFTITVNPKPSISDKTAEICSGATFTVSPTNGDDSDVIPAGGITTYTWTVSPASDGNVFGQSAQSVPQSSISQTLTNHTAAEQTVTYTVTPTSTEGGKACDGNTFQVIVTVKAQPTAGTLSYNGGDPICTAGSVTVLPTWAGTTDAGGAYSSSSEELTINSSSGVIDPSSSTPGTYTVTYTITNGSCQAVTRTAQVTIRECTDLDLYVTVPPYICENETDTIRISVKNNATTATTGLEVKEVFSSDSLTLESSHPEAGTITTNADNDTIVWNIGDLAAGTIVHLKLAVTGILVGTSRNITYVSAANSTTYDEANGLGKVDNLFLTVKAPPVVTVLTNENKNICLGESVELFEITGGESPWLIYYDNGTTAHIVSLSESPYVFSPTVVGDSTFSNVQVMSESEGCVGSSDEVTTISVGAPPRVSPISIDPVCSGNPLKSGGNTLDSPYPTVEWNNSSEQAKGWRIETGVNSDAFEDFDAPFEVNIDDNGKRIYYAAQNGCGAGESDTAVIEVWQNMVYPDIRIQVCPRPSRSIFLSSYLDTLNFKSVTWSAVSSDSPGIGDVTTGTLQTGSMAQGVHVYKYRIENECGEGSARAFVKNTSHPTIRHLSDTLVVCQCMPLSEHIQLNQMLGLDADGAWSYNNSDLNPYVAVSVAPAPFAGARIFNAAAAWGALKDEDAYKFTYDGDSNAAIFKFLYTTGSDSCLGDIERELVLIVTCTIPAPINP